MAIKVQFIYKYIRKYVINLPLYYSQLSDTTEALHKSAILPTIEVEMLHFIT